MVTTPPFTISSNSAFRRVIPRPRRYFLASLPLFPNFINSTATTRRVYCIHCRENYLSSSFEGHLVTCRRFRQVAINTGKIAALRVFRTPIIPPHTDPYMCTRCGFIATKPNLFAHHQREEHGNVLGMIVWDGSRWIVRRDSWKISSLGIPRATVPAYADMLKRKAVDSLKNENEKMLADIDAIENLRRRVWQ